MNEYIIVGDTKKYKNCLVCLCGCSFERAQEVLNRMLNDPTEDDKRIIDGHTNLRIKEVEKKHCWWNDGCD